MSETLPPPQVPPPGEQAPLLTQAEIQSLLADQASPGGVERIVESGLVSYERLPMLEIVFDRLVRSLTSSLRNFTNDNVEVEADSVESLRFGAYLDNLPTPAMLAVFKADPWDNYGLLVLDSALVYSMVDVLLGGRQGSAIMRIEGRPYTTIERTLIERLVELVLAELSASFEPLTRVAFRFERLEVNPRFATIARLSNAAVLARLRIDMEERGGRLDLLLPHATLEPVRDVLLQQFMGERFGHDAIWETHLAEELRGTEIRLEAVLDELVMPLSEIMRMEVGSRILLDAGPGAPVQLRCGAVPLFEARIGRRQGQVAVRIEGEIPRPAVSQPRA